VGVITGLTAIAGAFAAVHRTFVIVDSEQSEENRKFVRDWLLGLTVDDKKWVEFFDGLFAKFFGQSHFSFKCITRSFLLSVVLIAATFLLWYASFKTAPGFDLTTFIVAFIVGCIADYLSLGKTRAILTNMRGFARNWNMVTIVVVDAIATALIYIVVLTSSLMVVGWLRGDAPSLWEALRWVVRMIAIPQDDQYNLAHPFRALLLVALLTSAWLWVYLIAAQAIRTFGLLPTYLKPLSKVLDFENHPVRTIGYGAATVSAFVVAIITIISSSG